MVSLRSRPWKQAVGELHTVSVVSQLQHDLMHSLGILRAAEPGLRDDLREAKVGQRWNDHMERRVFLVPGLGEQRDDLDGLKKAPRPCKSN